MRTRRVTREFARNWCYHQTFDRLLEDRPAPTAGQLAALLNGLGYRTGHDLPWTARRVQAAVSYVPRGLMVLRGEVEEVLDHESKFPPPRLEVLSARDQ